MTTELEEQTDAELIHDVAVELMGWRENQGGRGRHWDPINDGNHRDEVLDELGRRGWEYQEEIDRHAAHPDGPRVCRIDDGQLNPDWSVEAWAGTKGLAVCLAALAAVRGGGT